MLDPASLEALRSECRAAIVHAGAAPDACALLMAGWLRDALGSVGTVAMRPGGDGGSGVLAVEIAGPRRRLHVERLAGREAATVVVTEADGGTHGRTLPLPDPDRARLLAGELEIQRRDRAFERALARAPV
jgi:hypothetical protein